MPWLMRLPGVIEAGTVVERPVSHLDMVATILDYTGQSQLDQSDGQSLRNVIGGTPYDSEHETDYVVSEVGYGPERDIGSFARLMIRVGRYKLMMVKEATSDAPDMLFDLVEDPYEMNNLLDESSMSLRLVGKAEHLKILLVEWMERNNGGIAKYYSNPKFNGNVGRGDIVEIRNRRTWRLVDQWQSDQVITLDRPVEVNGNWRTNAWLYIGRTTPGVLKVSSVVVNGAGRKYFTLSHTSATIQSEDYIRIRISFVSAKEVDPSTIDPIIVIRSNVYARREVRIQTWMKQ